MTEDNRWLIPELIARYELEPELQDVFVEGTFDREVLAQAVTRTRVGLSFYEIDSVDVPPGILAKHGLTSGNKQRVIALAKELASLPLQARVVCLVDRDLDHWFGELLTSPRLKWTKYCSLENHFLTRNIVSDVLITTGRANVKQLEKFVNALLAVLKQLYALRLSDRELALNLKWVALKKYLKSSDDSITLDLAKYMVALLDSNSKRGRQCEFESSHQSWMTKLNCDVRLSARGHDYILLLAWAIGQFGGQKEFATEAAVERLFVLLARSVTTLSTEVQ